MKPSLALASVWVLLACLLDARAELETIGNLQADFEGAWTDGTCELYRVIGTRKEAVGPATHGVGLSIAAEKGTWVTSGAMDVKSGRPLTFRRPYLLPRTGSGGQPSIDELNFIDAVNVSISSVSPKGENVLKALAEVSPAAGFFDAINRTVVVQTMVITEPKAAERHLQQFWFEPATKALRYRGTIELAKNAEPDAPRVPNEIGTEVQCRFGKKIPAPKPLDVLNKD